ncbi:MAG: 3-deoxy-8-phosphooctulonate synthase [Chitinophagales bacterium]
MKKQQLILIAGPCVVESEEVCFEVAEKVKSVCDELDIRYVFKSSYRKANRTKLDSFTGIGDEKALSILKAVRERYGVPVLTDIHSVEEVRLAADYVDILQIPAFLCRQTDLLVAAGQSGLRVNIKKGQFLSADAMQFAAEKVESTGNKNIWLTERGNSFGYGDLVVDFRNIPIMQGFGYPVILDVTHAVQQPNQGTGVTGGTPQFIATLAKAGVAAGVDGLFIETHPSPSKALSDGSNMLPLDKIKSLLIGISGIRNAIS